MESVEVWGREDVRERGVGLGLDEGSRVVGAVNGGGVVEASCEGVEVGECLGEGGLKELGFGGEGKCGVGRVEESHVAVDIRRKLV